MHDIDSTARELVDELLGSDAEEFESEAMEPEAYDELGVDSETDLAAELLEVATDEELDQFLGKLVGGAKRFLKSGAGKLLTSTLRTIARKALPMAGTALGNFVAPGLGGAIGGKLAGALGSSLGLEAESLSEEELELEVAKGVVRTAQQAISQAARDPRATTDPRSAVRDAVANAVSQNLPGLAKSVGSSFGTSSSHGASGRWVRRGNRIILYGV